MLYLGLLTAGAACAMTMPVIPFRISVLCIPLFLSVLALRGQFPGEIRFVAFLYGFFWMAGCVITASAAGLQHFPVGIFSAALLVLSFFMIRGLARPGFYRQYLDGVIASALVLAFLLAVVMFARAGTPVRDPLAVVHMLVIFAAVFLVSAGVSDQDAPDRSRSVMLAALSIPLAAFLLTLGYWQTAGIMARNCIAENRLSEAAGWTARERKIAAALDLKSAVSSALYRQAEIAGRAGNSDRRQKMLAVIARNDPADKKAVRELFLHSLLNQTNRQESLEYFKLLAGEPVEKEYADKILPVAYSAGDWQSFVRAVGLLPETSAPQSLGGIDWVDAAKAVYYRGDSNTAERLLHGLVTGGRGDWECVRILFHIYLSSKRMEDAEKLLNDANSSGHGAETAYFRSLLSHSKGEQESEKKFLQEVLQSEPAHFGARRRLKQAGMISDAEPLPGADGIVFEYVYRLLECTASRQTVETGGKFNLSFCWEILAPADPRWKVFVHVRQNVYGGFFFQADHKFGDACRLPAGNVTGSLLKYEAGVSVPSNAPPGDYSITVGIWDGVGNRNAAQEGDGAGAMRVVKGNRVLVAPGIVVTR